MSSRLPDTPARRHPENLGVLLREPFRFGTEVLHRRFAERGHAEVRPPHDNVFQFLDDDGTRVGVLAERAQITKQSMGYLVDYLEQRGYLERRPDPSDRRAALISLTDRGWEQVRAALRIIATIEEEWASGLGRPRMQQLRLLLGDLRQLTGNG